MEESFQHEQYNLDQVEHNFDKDPLGDRGVPLRGTHVPLVGGDAQMTDKLTDQSSI